MATPALRTPFNRRTLQQLFDYTSNSAPHRRQRRQSDKHCTSTACSRQREPGRECVPWLLCRRFVGASSAVFKTACWPVRETLVSGPKVAARAFRARNSYRQSEQHSHTNLKVIASFPPECPGMKELSRFQCQPISTMRAHMFDQAASQLLQQQ